ncbi:hypothetical protein [Pseudomonas sp. FEN]|uniref:hypothetical protein n=1 Tax=Pseudomonas sp. FEN TaxID=2767468 RepID=UPI001986538C|nr:hypothetical protein [Pseudomonas sp. FEN]CAD5202764.1 hypothetical protein [Pseudomonas sp. FEN]
MTQMDQKISATTGLPANAVITDDIQKDIEFFEKNGFIGPIKLYEPMKRQKSCVHYAPPTMTARTFCMTTT